MNVSAAMASHMNSEILYVHVLLVSNTYADVEYVGYRYKARGCNALRYPDPHLDHRRPDHPLNQDRTK